MIGSEPDVAGLGQIARDLVALAGAAGGRAGARSRARAGDGRAGAGDGRP